jgi:hypothetical protein
MSKIIEEYNVDSKQLEKLNRFVLQEDFEKRIKEVGAINLTITQKPVQSEFTFPEFLSGKGAKLSLIEKISRFNLDPKDGEEYSKKIIFSGYDESKYQFLTLEGVANITSHSLCIFYKKEIYPISLITFYFYTRSEKLLSKVNKKLGVNNKYIKVTSTPEIEANKDYAIDRTSLLTEHSIENSIIFIDGPMIGGNLSSYTIKLINELHHKNILPIFFVKNSDSNLVVDNSEDLRGGFNSDLHWSYNFLNPGQRTNLFKYTDQVNSQNSKIFCYIKPFNFVTPQRIEFHPDSYNYYKEEFNRIFNLIYYLIIVQGEKSNPQIRPIAIAEKYAREVIHTINPERLLRNSSLIQTMDQTRFER